MMMTMTTNKLLFLQLKRISLHLWGVDRCSFFQTHVSQARNTPEHEHRPSCAKPTQLVSVDGTPSWGKQAQLSSLLDLIHGLSVHPLMDRQPPPSHGSFVLIAGGNFKLLASCTETLLIENFKFLVLLCNSCTKIETTEHGFWSHPGQKYQLVAPRSKVPNRNFAHTVAKISKKSWRETFYTSSA